MSGPQRIQLRRTKGWRKPENTVVVARPSKWGNPVHWWPQPTLDPVTGIRTPADPVEARRISTEGFRSGLTAAIERPWGEQHSIEFRIIAESLHELSGKNLACWCPLDQPCHADVLLELSNTKPKVVDLMEALEASVAAAKKARDERREATR